MKKISEQTKVEAYKLEIDFLKHTTTLSSSFLLLLVFFVEKFSDRLIDSSYVNWAFGLLIGSVSCSILTYGYLVLYMEDDLTGSQEGGHTANFFAGVILVGVFSFLSALVLIALTAMGLVA